jgi:SAM-dependent MidA family methyltransferase
MKAALYDPEGGYYQRSDRLRWGREGDYRTSPERSELFAATFARYFAGLYDELEEFRIIEWGAGDGTFAAGVLHTLRDQFPAVFEATQYVIHELSDDACARARERLAEFRDRLQFCSDWSSFPAGSGIFFSNELLDAFPVHRVIKNDQGLSEFYVTLDRDDNFAWSTGPLSKSRLEQICIDYLPPLAVGQSIEINLEIEDWFAGVAGKLENGFVITVDYGDEAQELYDPLLRPHGTLRGFSRHGFVDDVLAQPGENDISSTVDWTLVKRVGKSCGFDVVDFASQDKFLLNAGLLEQLEYRLSCAETESEKLSLTTSAREMILPGGMASSFQVLVQSRTETELARCHASLS